MKLMQSSFFILDERLDLFIPTLQKEWESYPKVEQELILLQWEQIRGSIPDKIKEREATINTKQDLLEQEENFNMSCELNAQIAEYASIINDLWLLYRTNQGMTVKKHL